MSHLSQELKYAELMEYGKIENATYMHSNKSDYTLFSLGYGFYKLAYNWIQLHFAQCPNRY